MLLIFGALSFPSSLVHKTDVTPAILSSDFDARVQSDFISAFELRTLWRYTDMFIIIIVIIIAKSHRLQHRNRVARPRETRSRRHVTLAILFARYDSRDFLCNKNRRCDIGLRPKIVIHRIVYFFRKAPNFVHLWCTPISQFLRGTPKIITPWLPPSWISRWRPCNAYF